MMEVICLRSPYGNREGIVKCVMLGLMGKKAHTLISFVSIMEKVGTVTLDISVMVSKFINPTGTIDGG